MENSSSGSKESSCKTCRALPQSLHLPWQPGMWRSDKKDPTFAVVNSWVPASPPAPRLVLKGWEVKKWLPWAQNKRIPGWVQLCYKLDLHGGCWKWLLALFCSVNKETLLTSPSRPAAKSPRGTALSAGQSRDPSTKEFLCRTSAAASTSRKGKLQKAVPPAGFPSKTAAQPVSHQIVLREFPIHTADQIVPPIRAVLDNEVSFRPHDLNDFAIWQHMAKPISAIFWGIKTTTLQKRSFPQGFLDVH